MVVSFTVQADGNEGVLVLSRGLMEMLQAALLLQNRKQERDGNIGGRRLPQLLKDPPILPRRVGGGRQGWNGGFIEQRRNRFDECLVGFAGFSGYTAIEIDQPYRGGAVAFAAPAVVREKIVLQRLNGLRGAGSEHAVDPGAKVSEAAQVPLQVPD